MRWPSGAGLRPARELRSRKVIAGPQAPRGAQIRPTQSIGPSFSRGQ